MADDNNQNNQQNQQKQKGGGGGGGSSGITFGGKIDPAQMNDETSLGKLVTDQIITALTAAAATAIMYGLCRVVRGAFNVPIPDKPALQQGGGGGQIHPGQITGALFNLKKSDPDKFAEIMGKVNPPA